MKKLLFIPILPLLSLAVSFDDIQKDITNSLTYKLTQKQVKLSKQKLNQTKSKNYGSLDVEYDAIHFKDQPFTYIKIPPIVDTTSNLSDKNHFIAQIKYSYPLFTGYAISNMIEKSKLEYIKEKLNLNNVKRMLILQTADIYSKIYALKEKIKALNVAKKALISSKEKALGFYNAGLLDKSKVDEIEAKYYEILADIQNATSQKNALLNTLSYILNKKIDKIDSITTLDVTTPNFQNRPDVKMIKQTLKIASKDLMVAKSSKYPQVGLEVALKREGDNFSITKNDYQNIDKSYVALAVKYNIFSGGAKKAQIEMAKIAKESAVLFYNDYLNKIKTEYNNDKNSFNALKYQLESAKKEIVARKSYYDYIQAKFNEGLADSSDLNDAISRLALAKAKKESINSKLFLLSIKLKVNGGDL